MAYVAQESVVKDGVIYSKGQEVKGLNEAEVARLKELGAIAEGEAAQPGETAQAATQQSQSVLDRAKAALGGNHQPSAEEIAASAAAADNRQI